MTLPTVIFALVAASGLLFDVLSKGRRGLVTVRA
jgi:hypothetical protein